MGLDSGKVQIWDIEAQKVNVTLEQHEGRVGALAWTSNLLGTASKDRSIIINDMRCKKFLSRLQGHKQEVCGLKWSPDE